MKLTLNNCGLWLSERERETERERERDPNFFFESLYFELLFSDTHREDRQGNSKVSTYSILRKSMTGLVFLLIFVMIAYMLLFVFQKLTVRRVIPSFDVENKENGSRGKVDS